MRKYKFFHGFILAFFSPAFYRDVRQHWKGVGFGYLFMMLAVLWVPGTWSFSHELHTLARQVLKEIPKFSIQDGELRMRQTKPWVYQAPKQGNRLSSIPQEPSRSLRKIRIFSSWSPKILSFFAPALAKHQKISSSRSLETLAKKISNVC